MIPSESGLAREVVERDADGLAVGGALPQPRIPALEPRQRRPLDRHFVPAIERHAGGDVGQGEGIAGDAGPLGKLAVEEGIALGSAMAQRTDRWRGLVPRRRVEERRVGKGWVRRWSCRWSPNYLKKKKKSKTNERR